MPQCFQEQAVVDVIEQTPDVIFQHPVALPAPYAGDCERIVG